VCELVTSKNQIKRDKSTPTFQLGCCIRLEQQCFILQQQVFFLISVGCCICQLEIKSCFRQTIQNLTSRQNQIQNAIFQLIVGSKQTYQRKPQQDLVDSSLLKIVIFETSDAFSRRLIVTFVKPNANFPLLKSSLQSAPNFFAREK